MVDRLEELLNLMEDEDEDEQEDALALTAGTAVSAPAAPAPEIETEEGPGNGMEKTAEVLAESGHGLTDIGEPDQTRSRIPGRTQDRMPDHAPSQASDETPDWALDRTLNWTLDVETLQAESRDDGPEAAGAAESGAGGGAAEDGGLRRMAAELWQDGLAAPVTRHDGTAALRVPGAGDVTLTELAGRERPAGAPAELAGVIETMTEAERGLEELYRWTAQASRPPMQNLPVEQAGRTLRAEEPGRTAALTVDELDRAVRRDSRRYDGGMSIF